MIYRKKSSSRLYKYIFNFLEIISLKKIISKINTKFFFLELILIE